jgi:hypothetical protein
MRASLHAWHAWSYKKAWDRAKGTLCIKKKVGEGREKGMFNKLREDPWKKSVGHTCLIH